MGFTRFASTPTDGLKNTSSFPTVPSSETAARKQIQDIIDQINACGNALEVELEASGGAAKIGALVGGVASTIQAFITLVEAAGIGSVPSDGTITNAMIADTCKIGLLASLNTAATSIVNAINKLDEDLVDLNFRYGNTNISISLLSGSSKIDYFAYGTLPTGYLLANGQAVSRTTYSALFSAIGTTYGAGNGTTTFNVPNLTATSTMQVCIKI
jgi:hypothetical protein